MIEQEIKIRHGEDPFEFQTIKVNVPRGTKILSEEPYVLELLSKYGITDKDVINIQQTEGVHSYTTEGVISYINETKTEAHINIDPKHTAICNLTKEPEYVLDKIAKNVIVNVRISSDRLGNFNASISDAIDEVKLKELYNSIGDKTVGFNGKVIELIHGGYWVDCSGIKCFMPGSLGGLNKLYDFESLVGQELIVMPVTYSHEKDTIVVSHREYLKLLIPDAIEELRKHMREEIIGFVTGTTEFGIFAEFNKCLTGLIPKADLNDETLSLFQTRNIKPGDNISFWVNEIISNNKIILSQKGPKENAWDLASEKYKPMMITTGKVTKITKYGAFVELEKGISGLVHKSKLKDLVLEQGDIINVKIQSINPIDKKITMTVLD